jgi:aerobic carbon-monoxide dehydrogenase large subunit
MATASIPKFVGERIRRREDRHLILGEANYVDDIGLEGMLHAAFVRSPHAHARIRSVDLTKARSLDSVVFALSGEELRGKIKSLPCDWLLPNSPAHPVLALDKVRFVGEAVAVVVASDPYLVRDAAESVEVDYEPLEAVIDPEKALEPGAPIIHEQFNSNLAGEMAHPSPAIDEVMRQADRITRFRIANQRLAPMPMETRGVLARWDPSIEELTVWSSTQFPHLLRSHIADLIGIAETRLRVIAPEVGGGFGAKGNIYPEDSIIAYLAMKLRRPVKWIEQRREHLATLTQGRGQVAHVEAAIKNDGTLLGIKVRVIGDMGAYLHLNSPLVPLITGMSFPNAYNLRAAAFSEQLVFTNKMSTDTYRGAGMPEAITIAERTIELVAAELGLDAAEVRRRNLVPKEAFPFTSATGLHLDSGDYEKTLDKALELIDYQKVRAEQADARQQGRCIGIGLSCYVELAGFGPSAMIPNGKAGGWESATVKIEPDGNVLVMTGSSPHGQGLATTYAQITADALGVEIDDVRVIHGDTGRVQYGIGTFGSRSIAVGGAALSMALEKVKDKMKKIASFMMEVPPDQLSFAQRRIAVGGDLTKSIAMRQVVDAAYKFKPAVPGLEPGLEASHFFEPPNFCAPFGTHAAVIEVDTETGNVSFRSYVAVYDCGTVINPLIVEGQVFGGSSQGIGQALYEEVLYDESGQLLSGSLMDYAVPKATMLPHFEIANTVTPTPINPLGAKGIGESGCIASSACVLNAVFDALWPLGVRHLEMPLKPERIWRAIRDAKKT